METTKTESKPTMKEEPKVETQSKEVVAKTKEVKEQSKEVDQKKEEKSVEKQPQKKKEEKIVAKEKVIANGYALQISPKFTKDVCKMISRKDPDTAIRLLEGVVKGKQPVKMTSREVPHQKGKGIAGARFPKTAAAAVLGVVKQLKANAVVGGIEEPIIAIAMANQASAPLRRGGRKSKRTHVYLEAQEKSKVFGGKK